MKLLFLPLLLIVFSGCSFDLDKQSLLSLKNASIDYDQEVTEAGSLSVKFLVENFTDSIKVNYRIVHVTTNDNDFTAVLSGEQIIEDPSKETEINIAINQDDIFELNEDFKIELNLSVPGKSGSVTVSKDIVLISDDLEPEITINDVSSNESVGSVDIEIQLSRESSLDTEIQISMVNGTTSISDFPSMSQIVTIPAGVTSYTYSIPVSDDSSNEGDENFSVNVTSSGYLNLIGFVPPTLTIVDDDLPQLSVSQPVVSEGAGSVSFTVSLDSISSSDINFDWTTVDSSAVAGLDYVANSSTATLLAGNLSTTVIVFVSEDSLDEVDETFNLVISNPTNATINVSTGVATISDNDSAPNLSVSAGSAT